MYVKWADKYFARIRVNEVKTSESEKAVSSRLQFGTIGKLAKAMKYVTAYGFPNRGKRQTATAAFVQLNYSCCMVDDAQTGAATIDYPSLQFSQGSLRMPKVTVSYAEAGHQLAFTVTATEKEEGGQWTTDVVYAVILDSEYNQAVIERLGTRGDGGQATVELDEDWKKENLHVYAFCVDEKGKDASPTKYLPVDDAG